MNTIQTIKIVLGILCLQTSIVKINANCGLDLGMQSGHIKDAQITASHWLYKSNHYSPTNARLNNKSPGGAWCSQDITQVKNQYIQVDLLKNTKITAIATQARHNSVEYIEAYEVQYRRNNETVWRKYQEQSGITKKFTANYDNDKIVKNSLEHPIIARYIRVYPHGEEFTIYCTRLEFYGCKWSHEQTSLLRYTAPLGAERQGIDMRDSTYDGNYTDSTGTNGLGKLTDDIYGGKNDLPSDENSSPWVAYNTKTPEIKFEFQKKNVIKQIMLHVNNNKNIKIFSKVDILISTDNVNFNHLMEYTTIDEQHKKLDAYPVVINLGEAVTKYLMMRFTKQSDWMLLSEVVFMTDTYPPNPLIPRTTSATGNKFTGYPMGPKNNDKENNKNSIEKSKGLSFPIIITIALVTIVLALIVAVIFFKSYRKNRKQDSIRCSMPAPQAQLISPPDPKQDAELLYDERMMALHMNTIIPQNGMYMQPAIMQGNNGYNTQVIMS